MKHFNIASKMGLDEDIEEVKSRRAIAKGKFTRKCNTFLAAHHDASPATVLNGIYEEVGAAFKNVERINEEYLELLYKSVGEGKLTEEADVYMSQLETSKLKVKVNLEVSKQAQNQNVQANGVSVGTSNISVKKLDPPSFSGNVREFPNFKEDYTRLVVPTYGKDPYVLRQCLSGDALLSVRGLENDYDAMQERLEQKYGSPRKVVDLIVGDLRALKPVSEGDDKGLIKMIETVERCFLDLKRMGLQAEMSSTNVLGLVERVMPPTQKREWVAVMDEITVKKTGCSVDFEKLLEYLQTQRRRSEYMGSSIRNVSNKSSVNNMSGVEVSDPGLHSMIKDLHINQSNMEKQLLNVTKTLTSLADSNNRWRKGDMSEGHWCWLHETDTHDTPDCYSFKLLNDRDKVEVLRKKRVCYNCMMGQHLARFCTVRDGCTVRTNNKLCGIWHHPLLHKAQIDGSMYHYTNMTSRALNDRSKVMLMVSSVHHKGIPITTLWDSGSDITVITHSMAKRLGIAGRNISIKVTKVGNITENCITKEYTIPLVDQHGKVWHINAYGMDEITSNVWNVDTLELSRILKVQQHLLIRPVGKVDMLIGTDCCELLPKVIKTVGSLQLLENQFGYCVRGRMTWDANHQEYTGSGFTVNHISVDSSTSEISVCEMPDLKMSLDNVFGGNLDLNNETCVCKQDASNTYTIKEKRELDLIEQGLTYDQVNKVWVAKYPWIKNPMDLPNNYAVAVYRMKATEKRLSKLGHEYCELYQGQIDEMINKGVARKLDREEIESHVRPIHYVHHHEVMKPDSSSTPMRIVFDSSSNYHGHQLNSYWAKGPDMLNSMLGVLLRMRQGNFVVVGDISRMYHTIKLDKDDQHTHRFIWRNFNLSKAPEHYVLTTVTFGDRPSGIIATLALRHTAEKHLEGHPEAAQMIIRNTYVDDMVHSVSSKAEAYKIITDAEYILSTAGFRVKHWVVSGSEGDSEGINLLRTQMEKVLGMSWNVEKDEFFYTVRINFSSKYKGVHTEPNLLWSELHYKSPNALTRRMVLSQVASIFDPLGLVQPFILSAKLLMREMIMDSKDKGWDEPIQQRYKVRWMNFFAELYKLEKLKIRRAMKSKDAVGNPTLIIFSDGSKDAYGAVAYVRFMTLSGNFDSFIIMAKNKIAPSKQTSIPRIELCAAVMSCRLRMKIVSELDWKFEKVYHIVDSEIVRAQIQKDSHKFKSFVGTRVAEIQRESDPNDWWWVSSQNNPADMLTRSVSVEDIGSNSVWQNGPEFLRLPMDQWPVKQNHLTDVPDKICHTLICDDSAFPSDRLDQTVPHVNLNVIDLQRFSSYPKLLRVTSRIMAAVKARSLKAIGKDISSCDMIRAEKLWVKEAQIKYLGDWQKRFQRLGPAMNEEGIIFVGSRMKAWLRQNWNNDMYMLLPSNHNFTHLYLSHLHKIDHSGVESTIAKLRRKFWVPGVTRVVKSIKHRCVTCKRLDPQSTGQKMGELVKERLTPSPPFCHTACDIFGPFRIRDTVKRRTFGKAYGIIFNCLSTRSVYVDLIEGYDTQSFLITFRRFVSIRGYPSSMFSDWGPQLVSASNVLKHMFSGLDWHDICKFGKDQGMDWVFTNSADSPWQNGISEALIKSVKRSLKIIIGDSTFTFGELQTVLFEVANILNERPIGLKPGSDVNAGCYLCPNELLLGRASNHSPIGIWAESNTNKRLDFMNHVVNGFWRKWQRDYFPSLIVEQKWHVEKRNMRVGDLVLVQDSNVNRGVWKLAQVSDAQPGRDGLVRDVTIRYKRQMTGAKYEGTDDVLVKRSAHRLVVILPVEDQ